MRIDDDPFWNEEFRRLIDGLEWGRRPPGRRKNVGMADQFSIPGPDPGTTGAAVFVTLLLLLSAAVTVVAAESLSSFVLTILAAVIFPFIFVPLLWDGRRRRKGLPGKRGGRVRSGNVPRR